MCRHVRLGCLDVLCIIATVMAAVVGVGLAASIVREYMLTRHYTAAECSVGTVTWLGDQPCQACYATYSRSANSEGSYSSKSRSRCYSSTFPCVRIGVCVYLPDGTKTAGQLHTSAAQLKGQYNKCSYDVCRESASYSSELVRRYLAPYEALLTNQNRFDCYYSLENPTQLIPEKKHSVSIAFHAVFWPILFFLIFLSVTCFRLSFFQRREKFSCCKCLAKYGLCCFASHGEDTQSTHDVMPPPIGGVSSISAPPPPPYEYELSSVPAPYLSLGMNLPSYEQAVGTSDEEISSAPPPYELHLDTDGSQSPVPNISGILTFHEREADETWI